MTLLGIKKAGRPDTFQTPDWAVISLLNALPKPLEGTVWDPCMGKGNICNLMTRMNTPILGTDIIGGVDFLDESTYKNCPFTMEYDYIITNPPYSIKDKWLQRCYDLGKPFALLMPITALGEQKRYAMYKKYGIQVGLLPERVNYETPSGEGSGAHFSSAWFCHGFNFEKDITYLD